MTAYLTNYAILSKAAWQHIRICLARRKAARCRQPLAQLPRQWSASRLSNMSTRAGLAMLRRAAEAAANIRANDRLRAQARFPRRELTDDLASTVAGVADVAAALQRAVDAAGAELVLLGLNGSESELVLQSILAGIIAPPYPMENDDDQS